MSKYDVSVYIPKAIYDKLYSIANATHTTVSQLLAQIIKSEETQKGIDTAYSMLKEVLDAKSKMGASSQ